MATPSPSASPRSSASTGGWSKKNMYYKTVGDLYLNPKCLRTIIQKECATKKSDETYRKYIERLRGSPFSEEDWKNSCGISSKILETEVNADHLDVTHLICLLENIFPWNISKEVHKDDVDDPVSKRIVQKFSGVKDLRNEFFDCKTAAEDSLKLEIRTALSETMADVEKFYSSRMANDDGGGSGQNDARENIFLDKQCIEDSYSMLASSSSDKQLKQDIKKRVEKVILKEELTSENDKVKRGAVFHQLELTINKGSCNEVHEYTEILKNSEKFVVVEGVAGSGKSTLLTNIILQFFELQPILVETLEQFDHVILFECRERTVKTLSDVVEQLFGDLCSKQGKENVLEAILRLNVLFVIDSFDDVNTDSYRIVKEIIARTWRSGCRVLITTRPHCMNRLKDLLSINDVSFSQYGINPISKLDDQLKFLEKYERFLNEDNHSRGVTESFKSLESELQSFFTEPVNLMLFRHLHKHFPKKMVSWPKSMGVAFDIFRLYRKIAVSKLSTPNFSERENLVDDLFNIIGRAALELLHDNYVTFSEDKYKEIKEECKIKGDSEDAEKIILEVVLKKHLPLSEKGPQYFEFRHKIIQETFAAHYIVERIFAIKDSEKSPINSILDETSKKTCRDGGNPLADASHGSRTSPTHRYPRQPLRETLQYVVQELSRRSPRRFQRHWPELERTLQDTGIVAASDWLDCLRVCADVKLVAEIAADEMLKEDKDVWFVTNGREVATVAAMLRYVQVTRIEVNMRSDDLDLTRWKKLVGRRVGELLLVLSEDKGDEYKARDDLLQPLKESKVKIVHFDGCVGHPDSVTALASKAHEAEVNIRMAVPLDLSELRGKYKKLNVRTRKLPTDACPLPLPDAPAPSLQVDGVDEKFRTAVVHTITLLAPQNKRFATLKLQSKTKLSESELQSTLRDLHAHGIRTMEGDRTRIEILKRSGLINIYIREALPEKVEVIKVAE
ncbi:uncharacterized protein LOC108678697 [Hyalella azteca]|uniref:Uncharacterized protein LOC108678697 n=1 Tax=Hyalella azteca TaxID=294128 RepID=A0A8B7PA45_HYAAZ|nr:uncharacterized protein LOC108678697 [Hyalella azteca]